MGCRSSRIAPTPNVHSDTSTFDIARFQYAIPSRCDMAVCFVYFNTARSKRILMNYLYVTNKLRAASIPYFTLELVFDKPDIQEAFHLRGASPMFHKEHLCSLLEQKVPWHFKKLAFLDADIVFDTPTWYDNVSALLNSHQVVQPFSSANWLDLSYTKILDKKQSALFMDRTKPFDHAFHPGFGWAFQRRWFRNVGFFPYAITGCGDTLSVAAWLNVPFKEGYLQQAYAAAYAEYKVRAHPTITFCEGAVYHLWHGNGTNRQWRERHTILDGIPDVRSALIIKKRTALRLKEEVIAKKFVEYFEKRVDDGVS